MKNEIHGFFIGCNDKAWVSIVENLISSHGVRFDYISGLNEYISSLNPDSATVYCDENSAHLSRFPDSISVDSCVLDGVTLEACQGIERVCMELGDRHEQYYAFSYQERQRHYQKVLRFWFAMLEQFEPNFILFPAMPHMVYDYVLYELAKQKNIPTLMLLSISGLQRVMPYTDYKSCNNRVLQTYQQYLASEQPNWRLPDDMQEYLAKHQLSYEQVMPEYLRQRLDGMKKVPVYKQMRSKLGKLLILSKYKQLLNTMGVMAKQQARRISRQINPVAPINSIKKPFRAIEANDGLNGREWKQYKKWAAAYKRNLRIQYDAYVQPLDANKKYIYLPLQFQPERTSCPEGGRYSNQLLVLRLLSQCIPSDWELLVKENPSQLLPSAMHGERGRYAYYYHDLASIDKVRIVSLQSNQFELIDNAQAIATLTGTTGWEALMRAKPVLTFGHAWYNGCEGVFNIDDVESCRKAIEAISKGVEINQDKVHCFMAALDANSFKGYLKIKRYENQQAGIENNVQNIVSIIDSFLTENIKSQ